MSTAENEIVPTADVIPYEVSNSNLAVVRDPATVLEEARTAARALKDVIAQKEKPFFIGGEQYLEFEDWQTVASFFGCTAKVLATEYVDFGSAQGFVAHAVTLNAQGREISAADSMCLNDEDKWSTRASYEWHYVKRSGGTSLADPGPDELIWEPNPDKPGKNRPKKVRLKTGEVRVPFFQLRSMAQTRACCKTLRNVFSWVVVLAGYKATPAEEMTDGAGEKSKAAAKTDAAKTAATSTSEPADTPAAPAPTPAPAPPANIISEAQAKRFRAIGASRDKAGTGWTIEHLKALLADHGIASSTEIPRQHYNRLVDIVEKKDWDGYLDSKIKP